MCSLENGASPGCVADVSPPVVHGHANQECSKGAIAAEAVNHFGQRDEDLVYEVFRQCFVPEQSRCERANGLVVFVVRLCDCFGITTP